MKFQHDQALHKGKVAYAIVKLTKLFCSFQFKEQGDASAMHGSPSE